MSNPTSSLGLSCPSGGSFYICQGNATQFLGCCTSDPCSDGEGDCPQSDLRYASFAASDYSKIDAQACSGGSSGAKWYTCQDTMHPFLGCCSNSACDTAAGCASGDLVAARLSDIQGNAAVFLTAAAGTSAVTKTSSLSSKSTEISSSVATTITGTSLASTSIPTAKPSLAPTSQDISSSGLSAGESAGIGIGSAVAVIFVIGVLFIYGRRFLRARRGVVVRGSSPPTPSVLAQSPDLLPGHYYPTPSSLDASFGTYSPRPVSELGDSVHLSPGSNASMRQASTSLEIRSEQSYKSRWSDSQQSPMSLDRNLQVPQYNVLHQDPASPLETIAELDATGPKVAC